MSRRQGPSVRNPHMLSAVNSRLAPGASVFCSLFSVILYPLKMTTHLRSWFCVVITPIFNIKSTIRAACAAALLFFFTCHPGLDPGSRFSGFGASAGMTLPPHPLHKLACLVRREERLNFPRTKLRQFATWCGAGRRICY